jgi:outer membrane protein assembly factor BamA
MKRSLLFITLWASMGLLAAPDEINVNSKYLVERVDIAGGSKTQISRGLREDVEHLVGQRLNQETLERLSRRLRRELHARLVSSKLTRGSQPDHVVVLFEVKGRQPKDNFDLSLPKGIYHSKQGWSGVLNASFATGGNSFSLGVLSDGDELIERYAGLTAGYKRTSVFTDRVGLGFQFASYHTQWAQPTLNGLAAEPAVPGIYRTRQEFAPSVTLVLAEPLTLTAGTSFQRFQKQAPAAHTEASNAVTSTLRYERRMEDAEGNKHEVEAGYGLRAATKTLDSDYAYARHQVDAGYTYRRGRQEVAMRFMAGHVPAGAPLFERFVLGNTSTLRGWSKFDLDPLGATGVTHGSLEYAYRGFRILYDTGALWTGTMSGEVKHSLGVGFGGKDGFFLALAFPVKSGRAQPVLMAGVIY